MRQYLVTRVLRFRQILCFLPPKKSFFVFLSFILIILECSEPIFSINILSFDISLYEFVNFFALIHRVTLNWVAHRALIILFVLLLNCVKRKQLLILPEVLSGLSRVNLLQLYLLNLLLRDLKALSVVLINLIDHMRHYITLFSIHCLILRGGEVDLVYEGQLNRPVTGVFIVR